MSTRQKIFTAVAAVLAVGYSLGYDWSGASGVVTLTTTAEVEDGDTNTVANLTGIILEGSDTDIIFKNTGAFTLSGYIIGAGRIVKRGAGDLYFGTPHHATTTLSGWSGAYTDYYTMNGIVVETGDLYFPQSGGASCAYGPVTLNAGTTLHIHPDKPTMLHALNGSGTVSNGKAWTCWEAEDNQVRFYIGYYGSSDVSEFTGSFEGNFATFMCGNVRIHGPDTDRAAMSCSVFRNAFSSKEIGVMRISKFGNRPPFSYRYMSPTTTNLSAFASPLGIGTAYFYGVDYDMNYGGKLIYEGAGETTDRRFRFGGTYSPEYAVLDAGATGGLNFTGEFRTYGSDKYYGAVLTGSNTLEVTVSGKVVGSDGRIHYIKSGSGTWNWAPGERPGLAGAFFVVDGTLKFPSLANIGEDCALGLATNCWKTARYANLPGYWNNPDNRLNCEIVLGDWNTDGDKFPTLAYTGTTTALSDRRIGLIGIGGTIENTNTGGALKLTGGVSPRTLAEVWNDSTDTSVTPKTLCLTAVGNGNQIGPVSENAAGTIDIVKSGAGSWAIKRDFAISGDIEVNEGTLSIEPDGLVPYTWFRFTIMQLGSANNDASSSQYIWLKQLGLFDKDGNRLAKNLAFVGPGIYSIWHKYAGNYDWTALQPGQVTMGEFDGGSNGIQINGADTTPAELFKDSTSYMRATMGYLMRIDAPTYYFPIVFRLPSDSAAVKYYDVVQRNSHSNDNHVIAFKLEGSPDGQVWAELHRETECRQRAADVWNSTGVATLCGVNQNCRTAGNEFGYEVNTGMETQDTINLSTANTIKVKRGATFQAKPAGVVALPKLTVDCSGEGMATVNGFKIAAAGTLDVQNLAIMNLTTDLPLVLTNCSDVANLTNWTLTIDGSATSARIVVKDGSVKLVKSGTTILFR